LGVGLDASSMLRDADGMVLRTTTTSDLVEYLNEAQVPIETAWLGPVQQLEEAWFLGLRRNAGIAVAELRAEFGDEAVAPSLAVAERLAGDGLVRVEDGRVRLTARGRLISNDVFGEFLGLMPVTELSNIGR
jgi:oxygen-independent coproporphyrinogen III oxidase